MMTHQKYSRDSFREMAEACVFVLRSRSHLTDSRYTILQILNQGAQVNVSYY